jgi:signal transduction histidine kinase
MNQQLSNIELLIQRSGLTEEEKQKLLKEISNADKQWNILEFKLDRTEKVKKTTSVLLEETIEELEKKRKNVEAQNRELEIEGSLERVRTVAMGMAKPDDLLAICETMFHELQKLGFSELRNTLINIHNDDKGSFLNHDYSDELGKSITTVSYNAHSFIKRQLEQVRSANDAFSEIILTGGELNEWIEVRRKNGEKDDPRLENAGALYYYFYSIGTGAIGISTLSSIGEKKLDLLRRFRNVFNLCYQRYMDITQAEAQVRESQIETALERVRARAMAMRNSKELKEVAREMRNQLCLLGQKELETCAIHLWNESSYQFEGWAALRSPDNTGQVIESESKLNFKGIRILEESFQHYHAGKKDYILINDVAKAKEFFEALSPVDAAAYAFLSPTIENKNPEDICAYWSVSDFPGGSLVMVTMKPPEENSRVLLRRFSNVFGLAYRRYSDLQKAETQAREAQIQLALERVRARTMAMQKSDELTETAEVLFDQLRQLGAELQGVAFAICDKNSVMVQKWTSIGRFTHPYTIEPGEQRMYEAWKNGQEFYEEVYEGERQKKYYEAFMKIPEFRQGLQKFIDSGYPLPTWQKNHAVPFKYGYLLFITTKPFDEIQIFIRFGKVFEQTYTRFLDLQKAEAQAREAEIELGLERVRARAMAMQTSDELGELIGTVFTELTRLDLVLTRCVILIYEGNEKGVRWWMANSEAPSMPMNFFVKYTEMPFFNEYFAGWQRRELKWQYILEGGNKVKTDDFLFNETELSQLPDFVIAGMRAPERVYLNASFNNFGNLTLASLEPLSDEHFDILLRFAKVFDLTYTRFNDLKQAEAQGRESQIQLALERVRARTMAMQKSDELSETVYVLFQQFKELGEEPDQATIGIINEDEKVIEYWVTMYGSQINKVFKFSINEPNVTRKIYRSWKESKRSLVIDLSGKALSEFTAYRAAQGGAIANPNEKRRIINVAFFSKGLLNVQSNEERSEESIKLLERFAAVFEQTYTRFLDLQKAEAQAREAEIELALERVRAKTMAMQHSDELKSAATLLFQQAKTLGVPAYSCGYNIWEENERVFTSWMSTQDGTDINAVFDIPLTEDANFIRFAESRKKGEPFFVLELRGERMQEHYRYLKTIPQFKAYFDYAVSAGFALPETQIHHIANFSHGNLLFITLEPCPEFHDVFKRFAAVFNQTYTRFLDLQRAEEQAREAKIEAALEKVRSRSLAMHKSDELREVVAVVFDKLDELITIAFDGVSILIPEKDSQDLIEWVANPGKSYPEYFKTPYIDNPMISELLKARESGMEFFSRVFDYEEKNVLWKYAFENSGYKNLPDEIKKRILESDNYAYSVAFQKNSSIVVASISGQVVPEKEVEILKRFARAFEQSYIRFLDLQKAETQAREAEIELALERVRAKTMAMQHQNDLLGVTDLFAEQLIRLGFDLEIVNFSNGLSYGDWDLWVTSPTSETTRSTNHLVVPWIDHPYFQKTKFGLDNFKKGIDLNIAVFNKEEKDSFLDHLFTHTDFKDLPEESKTYLYSKPGFTFSALFLKETWVSICKYDTSPFTDEQHAILRRFANAFGQAYTRFLDLQRVEAQAKEAQIETALERVRSRTLAMQRSDELAETAAVLFKQLINLGIAPNRLYIGIIKDDSGGIEFWITDEDGTKVSTMFSGNANKNESILKMYEGWKAHQRSLMIDMQGKELSEYFHYIGDELHVPFKGGLSQKRRLQYISYFSKGFIGMASPDEQPQETVELLNRFAYVFNLTFTRFSDLKIAEAHAIQAEEDLVKLQTEKKRAEDALAELRQTQRQLIQSEKMASLGELTAGVAHEIQNPLNFVNNFSEVNNELIEELKTEKSKVKSERDEDLEDEILNDIYKNNEKINLHGKRADAIVKGMLQHSRTSTGQKEPTDINALCDEYLRLSYHGLRAKDKSFNAGIKTDFDQNIGKINVVPQDIGRVLLNLFNNAFYTVNEKCKAEGEGCKAENERQQAENDPYVPTVTVITKKLNDKVEIKVSDNGSGIPESIKEKIFQPFFTTKPTGKGTGLGLSLSYDIIKAHSGEIKVQTSEGEGSDFVIQLTLN